MLNNKTLSLSDFVRFYSRVRILQNILKHENKCVVKCILLLLSFLLMF